MIKDRHSKHIKINNSQIKLKGIIFVVLAGLGWGTTPLFVAALSKLGYSSIQMATARCSVAAIVLVLYMLIKYRRFVKISAKQLMFVALQGLSFYAMAVTYFYAISNTSASTATMFVAITPVLVTPVSVIFFKEKMTVIKAVAIPTSLVGCALIVGLITGFKFDTFGLFMGALTTVFYGLYSICTKLAMRDGMAPDVNNAYSFCFAALAAMLTSKPWEMGDSLAVAPLQSLALMMGIGIATAAFAGLMYSHGMKYLSAGIASSLAVIEPLTSTILSVVFLHEVLGVTSVVGIVLVLVSVVMFGFERQSR